MKTMTRPQALPVIRQRESRKAQAGLQLVVNLVGMYVANEIGIYVWRLCTGC